MKQEVHGQWFEHRLQVAGTHGLLDLSDELPEKDGSKVHLEINEWNCEFELFILESLRLVEEPSQRVVVQEEWVMASCNDRITCAPKDPPMIRSYALIRNRPTGHQITECPVFVFTHHPTETDNVCSEDGR